MGINYDGAWEGPLNEKLGYEHYIDTMQETYDEEVESGDTREDLPFDEWLEHREQDAYCRPVNYRAIPRAFWRGHHHRG